jgi:D-3-phosphoglycerate dehydrogenase
MRHKVALTNPSQHPPDAWVLDILGRCGAVLEARDCASREDVIALCTDANAVLVASTSIDAGSIFNFQHCQAIVRMGTGYDNIDVEAAGEAGIPVANVPEFCTDEVADHTLAMLLACVRRLVNGDREVHTGGWNPSHLMPVRRLRGQILGLIGFGKIGQAVAGRAAAFGLRIVYFDPRRNNGPDFREATACESLDELLSLADFVSLHVPLTEQTRRMLATPQFRRMKRTSILINCARGEVVAEPDLALALKEGVVAGAALDVFESEPPSEGNALLRLPNVLVSPHCAAHSTEALHTLRRQAYEEVARALRGEPLLNVVNRDFLVTRPAAAT